MAQASKTEAQLPIDQSVVIPRAVREAAARADALMAPPVVETPPQDPNNPTTETPPALVPVEPQPTNPSPAPFQMEQTPIPQTPPAATPQLPQEGNWEHMYKSEKGRREADSKRYSDALVNLQARCDQLEQLVASMQTAPPPAAPVPTAPLWTEEEREQWGDDLLKAFERVAERKAQQLVQPAMARVENTAEQLAAEAHTRMRALLDVEVPGWLQINQDPNFIAWTNLPDGLSGAIRINLLKDAWGKNEGPRVVRFFKSFLAEASPAPSEAQPSPPAAVPTPPPSNRIPLASLAAPGRSGAAAASPAAPATSKRLYKRSEIARFFQDKIHGRLKQFTAEQLMAQEQDIFAAQSEGRVIDG